jgi:hypothetical protein
MLDIVRENQQSEEQAVGDAVGDGDDHRVGKANIYQSRD